MRDPRYEQWLTDRKVDWEYRPSVPVDQIDTKASLENQARLVLLDDDKIERYATLMKEGTQFPALVAYRGPKGQWVLLTGNHRHAAARRAGLVSIDLYWAKSAESDLYQRDLLKRSANMVEGDTLSFDERLRNVMYLIGVHHREASDVAPHFGVSLNTIRLEQAKLEGQARLIRLGKPTNGHSKTQLNALRPIQSDRVFAEVSDLAVSGRLAEAVVRDIVKEVIKGGSEEEQLARVHQMAAKPEVMQRIRETEGGKRAMRANNKALLFRFLDGLDRLTREYNTAASLQITNPSDAERLEETLRQVHGRLTRVLHEYKRATTAVSAVHRSADLEATAASGGGADGGREVAPVS